MPRIPPKTRRDPSQVRKPPKAKRALSTDAQADSQRGLTAALVRSLEGAAGPCAVFNDIAERLAQEFEDDLSFGGTEAVWGRPIFADAARVKAAGTVLELERAGLRRIVAVLKRAVEQREKLGDLWPEGLLNAGIACAAAGDYAGARDLLEQAVDRFSGRGGPAEGSAA